MLPQPVSCDCAAARLWFKTPGSETPLDEVYWVVSQTCKAHPGWCQCLVSRPWPFLSLRGAVRTPVHNPCRNCISGKSGSCQERLPAAVALKQGLRQIDLPYIVLEMCPGVLIVTGDFENLALHAKPLERTWIRHRRRSPVRPPHSPPLWRAV
jgi:hypothetical protein